jgi:glycosyltransferase involved in cell wall biosynthesis
MVRKRFPFADLVIAGAGREEHALKTLCQTLALDSAVRFPGQVNAPAAYFPTSALFVLSSYHEGLPNALLEAAASGLPIVTTRASDGLVELVDRHPGVWLAPESTSESLAQTLITALTELEPGQRFQHTFVEPFRMNTALAAWEMLIDGFISGAPNAAVPARSGSTVASA